MELPKRKTIRLSKYDYSQNGYYFITICTQDREPLFGNIVDNKMVLNDIGKIIKNIWELLPKRFPIELDEYQIMPNHFHSIIIIVGAHHDAPEFHHDAPAQYYISTNRAIRESDQFDRAIRESPLQKPPKRSTLSQVIGYFKMNSTKQIRQLKNYQYFPVWQRNYFEHIIRNENELNKIREYIKSNPEMWERDRNNLIIG